MMTFTVLLANFCRMRDSQRTLTYSYRTVIVAYFVTLSNAKKVTRTNRIFYRTRTRTRIRIRTRIRKRIRIRIRIRV